MTGFEPAVRCRTHRFQRCTLNHSDTSPVVRLYQKTCVIYNNDMKQQWFVYMLRCSDDSLYTGITTDINRRVIEHNSASQGAKYTRNRRPVNVVFQETYPDRSQASQREFEIKKLSRKEKEQLLSL